MALVALDYVPNVAAADGEGAPWVTIEQSCHLVHGQGVRDEPRRLLRDSGVEACEMKGAEQCCGSAGIYNLMQPDMDDRVLERKLAWVRATGAILPSRPIRAVSCNCVQGWKRRA